MNLVDFLPYFCFILAGYSVIANDSIQTLGTWISSNQKHVKWYWMALAASSILIITIVYSWYTNTGDISYHRLDRIPFQTIKWYHVIAPIVLVILTRMGVPVSTSFLILTTFASQVVFEKMLVKSVVGYMSAAMVAYAVWLLMSRVLDENKSVSEPKKPYWRIAQWFTTGFLWWTWLAHDMANVAVFLPRQLSSYDLSFVLFFLVSTLFYIFYVGGGKIQNVVLTKKNTRYVRSATLIDLVYALILLFFKELNDIPMSTTWVFLGLLAGRELAIYQRNGDNNKKSIFPIIRDDFGKLVLGLIASIA
ncbi:MAG: hypothetical protein ACC656_15460, partial [Candidatus Heimdallarchaeota archaeon]